MELASPRFGLRNEGCGAQGARGTARYCSWCTDEESLVARFGRRCSCSTKGIMDHRRSSLAVRDEVMAVYFLVVVDDDDVGTLGLNQGDPGPVR